MEEAENFEPQHPCPPPPPPPPLPLARLQLTARDPNVIDDGLVSVAASSFVEILCSGSRNLTWESSTGAVITEATLLHPTFNVFQTHNPTNNTQSLVIQKFSPNDKALYTCRTNLTANRNTFEESVYISSCKYVK